MPSITVGFNVGPAVLQAARGLFSVESSPSSFSKTGALGFTIAVTPANPTIVSGTEQFTATATYTDNSTANITTQVTWSSSNTAVATISNSSGTQGLATAVSSSGYTTITAILGAVSGNTTLSIVPVGTSIKWNPGHYLLSDVRDYHGGFSPAQQQGEIDILSTTGTGGSWAGSNFKGYYWWTSWSYLESTLGTYDFSMLYTIFSYLQSKCPGAHACIALNWAASGGNDPVTEGPPIPNYIFGDASTYGAGPPGGSGSGYGLSGWNGASGWQVTAMAQWRANVQNRYNALLAALATAVVPDGQGYTWDTHPLIEMIHDPDENSWNFWYGPAAPADWSAPAQNAQIESGMSAAVTAFKHTSFATYQSFGNGPPNTFPDPNLPGVIAYAASNRNALSNADVFGNGISAVSAHEIYCGNVWNGSAWVSGGTDYRGTMAYQAVIQGPDYQGNTPGGSGNVPAAIAAIFATCQVLRATHICWNIWDDVTGNPSSFVSTYLVPFINSHPVPNTTYPTNYPTQVVTTVTWVDPTQNTDGSAISGITGYLIGVRPTSTPYTSGPVSPYPYTVQVAAGATSVLLSAFTPAIPHGTYVSAAQAIAGAVYSAWSVESAPFTI